MAWKSPIFLPNCSRSCAYARRSRRRGRRRAPSRRRTGGSSRTSSARPGPWTACPRGCARCARRTSPAADDQVRRDAHIVEDDLGGVRGADAVLLNFWPCFRPGCSADDEAGLAAAAQLGVHRRHDHMDVGDAAVGRPGLGAVQHPLVLGLVEDGAGADRAHVAAGVGLDAQNAPSLTSSALPNICGTHSAVCSGCPRRLRTRRRGRCPRWRGRCPRRPRTAPRTPPGCRGRSAPATGWRRSRASRYRPWTPPGSAARGSPRARPTPRPPGGSRPWRTRAPSPGPHGRPRWAPGERRLLRARHDYSTLSPISLLPTVAPFGVTAGNTVAGVTRGYRRPGENERAAA